MVMYVNTFYEIGTKFYKAKIKQTGQSKTWLCKVKPEKKLEIKIIRTCACNLQN